MSRYVLLFLCAAVTAHAQGPAIPVGTPDQGALVNALALPLEGPFHLKITRGRERWWGTTELVNLILTTAESFHEGWAQRILVGDLSAREGGEISLHRSHENGLDVDVGYPTRSGQEQDPENDRGFEHSMVSLSGHISGDFNTEAAWDLARLFIESGQVQRIFIAPQIKQRFCRLVRRRGENETAAETLRRLTPLHNHRDHMHVRLYCPSGATGCVNLDDPQQGTGCLGR
jgi:penicillin-insensitive murein endopeptidase